MCDNTVASVGLLLTKKKLDTKENIMGFPDGSVVKNLPAKAGFDLQSGEIPYAASN